MRRILYISAGIFCSVLPPVIATLSYFPLWQTRDAETVISGISALLLIFSALPLVRILAAKMRTPSATMLWAILFVLFFSLCRIADEMCVISFAGMLGGAVGSIFFRLCKVRDST